LGFFFDEGFFVEVRVKIGHSGYYLSRAAMLSKDGRRANQK
jgi:hypothetical protein